MGQLDSNVYSAPPRDTVSTAVSSDMNGAGAKGFRV
jgi:hypothetical protein